MLYTVVSALVIEDEPAAKAALADVLPPGRRRPFHWSREGVGAREAMLDCIERVGVLAHAVAVACGRRQQELARACALTESVAGLIEEGCERLMIESRSARQNGRDRATILDTLRVLGVSGSLAYEWHEKNEPMLWIADAVGGAVRAHLLGDDSTSFDRLQRSSDLELEYRRIDPEMRKSRLPS